PELQKLLDLGFRNMVSDFKGHIWILIKKNGILEINTEKLNDHRFQFLGVPEGLPTNVLYSMNSDPEGNLWLSTILGAVYMNTSKHSFRVFNQAVGMDKN